jgi:cell division protein FtsI (penicillin-binding protein 3)/stage V sporulation protein D (sporulation-specific penicillin-binding protein)
VKPAATNRRITLLAAAFLLLLAATLARATWIQVVKGPEYAAMALRQHRETVIVPASRGSIVDRNGEPLAIGKLATTIYANPHQVNDARDLTLAAAKQLDLDPATLYPQLTDKSKGFIYVERKADPRKAKILQAQDFAGLGFYPEELRFYPQGPVASQLIGYAGLDNKGLEGLERSLEGTLAGTPGSQTIVKDPFGRALDVVETKPETPGRSVRLTIDREVQANAEEILQDTVRRWGARAATAVVMDPHTGEIYAMATAPRFNANRFATTRADRRRNRAVTDAYEPGSTFKLVTVAAALQDHVVTPKSSFVLAPTIKVADRTIHEAHTRGTERLTVKQIVEQSSNIGAITIAERLGAGQLASWVDKFGFGSKTGIDFPGESPGFALPLDQWSGSTIGTVPIGHGIAVTPIQMARAYAAIANGGVLVRPHLIDRIDGKTVGRKPGRRIVSRHVSDQMLGMLRGVVLEGTGTEAAIPGYTVAGKTGTAAKIDPDGTYSTSRYVASFVGMVPATKPRLVIMVMVDEPHGDIYGGSVAAPAFREIARFNLQHFEIPQDAPRSGRSGG